MVGGTENKMKSQERRKTLVILTAKKTSESVEEAKIDYDVNENSACQASKQTNKEERTMKTTNEWWKHSAC